MLRSSLRRATALRPWSSLAISRLSTAVEASPIPKTPPMLIRNLIGGQFVESRSGSTIDVHNHRLSRPLTTADEFKSAVAAAKSAFPKWRNTPVTTLQRVMLKLQELIRRDMDKLALNITTEQGKTLKDAQGDVFRGLEVVEHACGMGTLQMGEYLSNVVHEIDICSCVLAYVRATSGHDPVVMFPVAVTYDNTFILKPSEKYPVLQHFGNQASSTSTLGQYLGFNPVCDLQSYPYFLKLKP